VFVPAYEVQLHRAYAAEKNEKLGRSSSAGIASMSSLAASASCVVSEQQRRR